MANTECRLPVRAVWSPVGPPCSTTPWATRSRCLTDRAWLVGLRPRSRHPGASNPPPQPPNLAPFFPSTVLNYQVAVTDAEKRLIETGY